MCSCKLEIVTESGGERTVFRANGTFDSRDGEERALYRIDGDDGELFFTESFIKSYRRGRVNLEATFSEGAPSEIIIGERSFSGRIPGKTIRYILNKSETERQIDLCYDLSDSGHIQTFSLKIHIIFFSEEK